MNAHPDWHEFLESRGAQWQDGTIDRFAGDPDPEAELHFTALVRRDWIRFSGPDTRRFLQGQFTCDLESVTRESSVLGACCTPKGRMVANFRMLQIGDDLLLSLPRGQGAALTEALAKFQPFYKCTTEACNEEWAGIGLWGETAPARLQALLGNIPDSLNRCTTLEGGSLVRIHGQPARFELWLPTRSAITIWDRLATIAQPVGEAAWQVGDIRAGIGWISPALAETLVPQMLNLQKLDAISFTKGCYTGQEIVARMQYRGTLKKCTFRLATSDPEAEAEPGTAICTAHEDAAVGQVIQSARTESGQELLAVLRTDAASAGDLHLGSPDGPGLTVLELPYSAITD